MSIPSNQNPLPGHQSENSPSYYRLNVVGKKISIQKTAKKESSQNSAYTFLKSVSTNIDKLEDNGDIITCVDEVFKNYMKKYEGSFAKGFYRVLHFFYLGPKEPGRVKQVKELYLAVVTQLYGPKPKHDDEELAIIERIDRVIQDSWGSRDRSMSQHVSNCIQTLCWNLHKEERSMILKRLGEELNSTRDLIACGFNFDQRFYWTTLLDAIQHYESTFRAAPTGEERLELIHVLFTEQKRLLTLMDKNGRYNQTHVPALVARLHTFPLNKRSSFLTDLLSLLTLFPKKESHAVLKAISCFPDVLSGKPPSSKILRLLPEATRLNQLMALVPHLSQDFSANNPTLEEISYVLNVIAPELREAVFKKLIAEPSTLIGKTRSNVHFHSQRQKLYSNCVSNLFLEDANLMQKSYLWMMDKIRTGNNQVYELYLQQAINDTLVKRNILALLRDQPVNDRNNLTKQLNPAYHQGTITEAPWNYS